MIDMTMILSLCTQGYDIKIVVNGGGFMEEKEL